MATFRVGQRVRIVNLPNADRGKKYEGAETIITSHRMINVFGEAGYRTALTDDLGVGGVVECCLSPLTNPGDEAWAADQVKKWTKPEPVVPVTQQEKERT